MTKTKKQARERPTLTPLEEVRGELPQLKSADILFIRHKKGLQRRMLRKIMGSYWDHAALVLYPRDFSKQRIKTVIVESKKPNLFSVVLARGVSIHQLEKYIRDPKEFDIGIGRVRHLSDAQRERVITFMLMNVDAPYWPWTNWLVVGGYFSKYLAKAYLQRQRFSCSGLIQKAFYDAMSWNEKQKVIFKEGVWSPLELQELTNPQDIASSRLIEWIYNKH